MNLQKIKKFFPYIIIFFLGFLISGYIFSQNVEKNKEIAHKIEKESDRILQLKILGKTIENELGLHDKNDFEKAVIIRNHLYQNVPANNIPNYDFFDILNSYYRSVYDPEIGHICQGMQILYMMLLKSQNIPSRRVQMFDVKEAPVNNHASVEFLHQGSWYASDPQFNIMYKHNDEYLSYAQLHNLIKSNKPYKTTSNGFPFVEISSKNIRLYYIEIEKLIQNLVIDEVKITKNGEEVIYKGIMIPEDSDGVVKLEHRDYDAKQDSFFNPVYKFIYESQIHH